LAKFELQAKKAEAFIKDTAERLDGLLDPVGEVRAETQMSRDELVAMVEKQATLIKEQA